jgi:hypothetical protein
MERSIIASLTVNTTICRILEFFEQRDSLYISSPNNLCVADLLQFLMLAITSFVDESNPRFHCLLHQHHQRFQQWVYDCFKFD